ncbi:MAG: glycogen synthase [Candidatus Cellulosilyticum pullistercoris]|uniref:Glycogen synthase n=1 Tax=Candidatus Cellulosilyticum pullistercoris TaxID=2838521 RepID=A0A9E2KCN5_9FIRM|nr:glycogen synthase [Candidatus Cellulosilyticum pullistercoris]
MEKSPLKCLFVSSEVVPYAKTGGLADVIGSLPKKLREQGVDARVVMPYYNKMRNQFFDHDSHFLVSYDVYLGWRVQGIGVYYDDTILPTYFLKSDTYFSRPELYGYQDDYERFAFFCKGVLEMLRHIDFVPDIIHCNDWQTGPLCLLLKDMYSRDSFFSRIKTVYTIHNMKYQGLFGREALDVLELSYDYMTPEKIEYHGAVSYMKAGLLYSDKITTVSPSYAEEIKTYEYGCGLNRLLAEKLYYKINGILNGIDYDIYNPQTDPNIYKNYTWRSVSQKKENKKLFQRAYGLEERDCMLIGVVSRITDQKGFDLMKETIDNVWVMDKIMELDVQFVILGTGEKEYEDMFKYLAYRYKKRANAFLTFSEPLAQKIYAASDVFLMPSLFEPCGLGQLIAMRYGTVPVVRKTGGLKDTVTHYNRETGEGTGFEFEECSGYWMYKKIEEAYCYYNEYPEDFKKIQLNGMKKDFSWDHAARKYIELYESMI